jgi:putative pyruvate formate lyase activating enzyme
VGRKALVSSYGPHFGEERPLVGRYGSGTIFFSYCNLRCLFCQNYTISQLGEGDEVDASDIAAMMLSLQQQGCHNINFVSPSHVVPQILEALELAIPRGLRVPLVYNTGGYDSLATLRLLDGVFDIYMPDMKYSNERVAEELSGIRAYPRVNRAAVKAMQAQVGDLETDATGVARRGLIIRHLVLPGGLAGTEETFSFLAQEVSRNAYLNIMDQYRPCYRAHSHPQLGRPITAGEFRQAVGLAERYGLTRLDQRRAWVLL